MCYIYSGGDEMNTKTNTATETVPADIAVTAMALIMDGKSPVDAVFFAALDCAYDCYDKVFARAYGLKHWAELSEEARGAWDCVFDKKTRVTKKFDPAADYYEDKILARQEKGY
jgi:hypothetical protein